MANALDYYGDPDTAETRTFVRNFDRFFDCLNVWCTQESIHKRKPDLCPYRDPSDSRLTVCSLIHTHTHTHTHAHTRMHAHAHTRMHAHAHTHTHTHTHLWVIFYYEFQWLKEGFLGYLDDWEKSVKSREGFTSAQRNMMLLSQQTIEGLRITGV